MAKISLTRALSRISTLKKSIGKDIDQKLIVVSLTKGHGDRKRLANKANSVESEEAMIQSTYTSVIDQIAELRKLKRALIKANASVAVKIEGFDEMTIAEAIEYKNSLEFDKVLLAKMKRQYGLVSDQLGNELERINMEIEKAVSIAYSNDRKVDQTQYDAVAAPRRKENEPAMLDPLNVQQKIEKLESQIDGFLSEIDFALSEVNAKTEIEV